MTKNKRFLYLCGAVLTCFTAFKWAKWENISLFNSELDILVNVWKILIPVVRFSCNISYFIFFITVTSSGGAKWASCRRSENYIC